MIFSFTHTQEMPWMLPGIPPTNRYVEVALVAIVRFRDDKLAHEHISTGISLGPKADWAADGPRAAGLWGGIRTQGANRRMTHGPQIRRSTPEIPLDQVTDAKFEELRVGATY